jgi:hypothetical protein
VRAVPVATADPGAASAAGVRPQHDTRVPARKLLRPGWPLAFLFYGFPLWWALGLAHLIFYIAVVPMAFELLRRRPLRAPRWFGIWLIFLAWILFGVVTLWAHAPGTEYGGGISRLINFGLNYMWYMAATIVLLYIYNLRESELSIQRIQRMAGFMFIITAMFGLAGTLDPSFQFKSLMEYIVPRGITHAEFIHSMIHPALTSSTDLLGYDAARPIAPFMYANAWGNNLAMYAPMFVAAWFGGKERWRSVVGVGILLMAAIPVIHSLNRGMWLGLSLALVFTVIRFAIAGQTKPLNMVLIGVIVGTIGFLASPLYGLVQARLQHPHSNERRGNLSSEVVKTAVSSPFIGYGGTRGKQGGYASIAAANSTRCASCGAPALGTQGYLWLLLLGSGYLGASLCLMFLLSQFLSAVRRVNPTSMVACVTILMSLVFFFVYDSLGSALFTLFIAIACNARVTDQPHVLPKPTPGRRARPRRGRDLADYVSFARRNALVVAVFTVVGGIVGGGLAISSPTTYTASTTVLMSRAPMYVDTLGYQSAPSVTIDTDAQLYLVPSIARRVSRHTGVPEQDVSSRVLITAKPLTRVLNVNFRGRTPEIARDGSRAAAHGMIHERQKLLVARSTRRLTQVRTNLARLQGEQTSLQLQGKSSSAAFLADLNDRIQVLQGLSAQLQDEVEKPGQVIGSARIVRVERARTPTIWGGSGAGLGFLFAVLMGWFRPKAGWLPRLRPRRSIPRVWEVPSLRAR